MHESHCFVQNLKSKRLNITHQLNNVMSLTKHVFKLDSGFSCLDDVHSSSIIGFVCAQGPHLHVGTINDSRIDL